MKKWRWHRTGGVAVWPVAALLCVLAGHPAAQPRGAADWEAPVVRSSNRSGISSALFVPVILSASGQNRSFFKSELTLTNRGDREARLQYIYTAHRGGGSGTASDRLAPGQQKIEPDALAYLRRRGIPISHSGNRIGTLRVEVAESAEVGVSVRTTTLVPEGRAGLAYPGIAGNEGFQEAVYLCGLRQNEQDRSNVAIQHMGTPEEGPITLRTTVYSGDPETSEGQVLEERMLAPGGFHQYNGILNRAGFTNGYVKVERVEGEAPFYAYGVINDQANSDGSFVFPVTASSLTGTMGQTLPVVVETGVFTSELTVTNFSDVAKRLTFRFRAEAVETTDKTASLHWTFHSGQQVIVPNLVEMMRQMGTPGIGPPGRTIAGALFATVAEGDMSGIVIGARTSSPDGRGGQYGVSYNAVPDGAAFTESVWVDGLQQNEENRSNLALVNTGEADESPSVFRLDIYDGETGTLANTVTGLRVAARGWRQINGILHKYAPGITQGYVRIQKISGNNPFLAYGVINDGGAPGQRSGDGAYLLASSARERIHDPGTAPMTDREVLEALYEATDGPNWRDNTNWLTDAPLGEWYGVEVDGQDRVIGLRMAEWVETEDGRREKIGNGLTGEIPSELGSLSHLRFLDLGYNQLEGEIPPELGQLSQLQSLFLAENQLTGPIPPELGQLSQLQWLILWGNQLTGPIPPELGRLSQLRNLNADSNQLTGPIPPELGILSRLEYLLLSSNQLTGSIPPSFLQLEQLSVFDFSANSELCVPGTTEFFAWLKGIERHQGPYCNQSDVAVLDSFFQNTGGEDWTNSDGWLRDVAVSERYGVRADSLGRVTGLDLSDNGLTGRLPRILGRLAQLTELRIDGNALSGRLPLELARLPLQTFHYADTELCAPVEESLQVWLNAISSHEGSGRECAPLRDRDILVALYEATDGANWVPREKWLRGGPLSHWFGVQVDDQGRVIGLDLTENNMTGPIPPELGHLAQLRWLSLRGNQLTGAIPPELGQLSQLQRLSVARNQLTGPIPRQLGHLKKLEYLDLTSNNLTGPIPAELGNLSSLTFLALGANALEGPIPPELGRLTSVERFLLWGNNLTGSIPPALGKLSKAWILSVSSNQLSGPIPPELGNLANMKVLQLSGNGFEGAIPPEVGGLSNLEILWLSLNNLTGPIPPELGALERLETLSLSRNYLTGPIPPELGGLARLKDLGLDENNLTGPIPRELQDLSTLEKLNITNNDLEGPVPPELGGMSSLRELGLTNNAGMAGPLPTDLTALGQLDVLLAGGTDLCAPTSPGFQTWLQGVHKRRLSPCFEVEPLVAYLVQAVQSREFPVPLVAGENALLRVFVTVTGAGRPEFPPVRARFYVDGRETHVEDIRGKTAPIPTEVNEGNLSIAVRAEIPAVVIQPGLEMVIEIDPEGTLGSGTGLTKRIPETGRQAVEVRAMPKFDLTLIPFLWRSAQDKSILGLVEAMAADPEGHEMLWHTRTLLPIGELEVTAHEPVVSTSNNAFDLRANAQAIRAMEGGTGYYMGLMPQPVTGATGVGFIGDWVSFSIPNAGTIAHELGHNLSLYHAPCGDAGGPDPSFPETDGSIGAWGYDFREGGKLVPPSRPDLMSYCGPYWISDYHFTNALRYRLHTAASAGESSLVAAPRRSLLLWGGMDSGGTPFLEPAFVVEAPASLPRSTGQYQIVGRTADGDELFSLPFRMPEAADGDGRSSFAFVLPVQPKWADQLASITLSGSGGSTRLDQDTNRPVTILRNRQTGQIRAILRGAEAAPRNSDATVSALSLDPGLERLTSSGIPDPENW